jgi:hypothetical protein
MVIRVERRREARERTYQLVNVARLNREGVPVEQALGRTLDLSRGGLRVELDHDVPTGARVQVDLALREALVCLQAEVKSVQPEDGAFQVGLEFKEVDDPTFERIDDFLRARVAERTRT